MTAAIIRSVSQLKHAAGILFLFFLVSAILGMGFFKGALKQRCFYVTTPDSPPELYRNVSLMEFVDQWTVAFGDFTTSPRSLEVLMPTLRFLNLSAVNLSAATFSPGLKSAIEQQALRDNMWRFAVPACGRPGLLSCDESYIPPLCTDPVDAKDRISLGGYQCPPDENGNLAVCRTTVPFFEVPNNNPPLFKGWCEFATCSWLVMWGAFALRVGSLACRVNFDNIGTSFLTIFQVLTQSSWADMMCPLCHCHPSYRPPTGRPPAPNPLPAGGAPTFRTAL